MDSSDHTDCSNSASNTFDNDVDAEHDGLKPSKYEEVDLSKSFVNVLSVGSGSEHQPKQTHESENFMMSENDEDDQEVYRLCELALEQSPKKAQQQQQHQYTSPRRSQLQQQLPPSLSFCLSSDDHDLESNKLANTIQERAQAHEQEHSLFAPSSPVFVGVFHTDKEQAHGGGSSNEDGIFREKKSLLLS
jgi:hypothetical protein